MMHMDDMNWNRTAVMNVRLEDLITEGTFKGRHIIARDTIIEGGVYVGAGKREAIVVDSLQHPFLQYVSLELYEKLFAEGRVLSEAEILSGVYEITAEKLKTSLKETERIIAKYSVGNDRKISLEMFIQEGYGVCRHHALLAGFLLEKLCIGGHLQGKVSVDRNTSGKSGHAWARYTRTDGVVMILDATHQYVGTLHDSLQRPDAWDYFRQEDKAEVVLPKRFWYALRNAFATTMFDGVDG